ncbi:hypothetical protein SOHN41_01842 [Shewanella sp. HN-41]|nr:hypothetical protein SOHN41_01842 [Shewanella sp. HN-41]
MADVPWLLNKRSTDLAFAEFYGFRFPLMRFWFILSAIK